MKINMKQVIGLWGVTYLEVANYLGYKSASTIEKRIKNDNWAHHEVVAIVEKVFDVTGVRIDLNLIKTKK